MNNNNKTIEKFEIGKVYKGINFSFRKILSPQHYFLTETRKNKILICLNNDVRVSHFLPHGKFLIVEDNIICYILCADFNNLLTFKNEIVQYEKQ